MTKQQVLNDISALYKDIDKCITDYVTATLAEDKDKQAQAEDKTRQLLVAAKQELSLLSDYINENIK